MEKIVLDLSENGKLLSRNDGLQESQEVHTQVHKGQYYSN